MDSLPKRESLDAKFVLSILLAPGLAAYVTIGQALMSNATGPRPIEERSWWVLDPGHVVLIALTCALFLLLSYLPLPTSLWGHLVYGDWILEHRQVPAEDPVLPFAAGIKIVDGAWLSQSILAAVEAASGEAWLSCLLALIVLATILILGRAYRLAGVGRRLTMAGVLATLALGWSRLTIPGPENFAALCFAALLWLIAGSRADAFDDPSAPTLRLWLGLPLLLWVWANLHPSFIYGLAVLACCVLGRAFDTGCGETRRGKTWRHGAQALATDPSLRRWLLLGELAAMMTLINPYGIDLMLDALGLMPGAERAAVPSPSIFGPGGRELALSWVVLLIVLRHSRRPMSAAHALMLAVFSLVAAAGGSGLLWYAMVFPLVLLPQLAELSSRRAAGGASSSGASDATPGRFAALAEPSWRYSLIAALVIWLAFAFSPLGNAVLGGGERPRERLLAPATPLALAGHLPSEAPEGPIWSPADWAGWLVWAVPSLEPFATSGPGVLPRQVLRDDASIARAESGWPRVLDRYRIEAVILDKSRHRAQAAELRRDAGWRLSYEDPQAMLFARVAGETARPSETPPTSQEPPT